VKKDRIPERPTPMKELLFTRQKSNKCKAFMTQMVTKLAEDLPTGFNLGISSKDVLLVLYY
jgi:hypothetical protein